jgi:hypothetical protein
MKMLGSGLFEHVTSRVSSPQVKMGHYNGR